MWMARTQPKQPRSGGVWLSARHQAYPKHYVYRSLPKQSLVNCPHTHANPELHTTSHTDARPACQCHAHGRVILPHGCDA